MVVRLPFSENVMWAPRPPIEIDVAPRFPMLTRTPGRMRIERRKRQVIRPPSLSRDSHGEFVPAEAAFTGLPLHPFGAAGALFLRAFARTGLPNHGPDQCRDPSDQCPTEQQV